MRIRPMVAGDHAAVSLLAADDPVCWVSAEDVEGELAAGRYRHEWTWLAEERGRLVARALWWGRGGTPLALDCLWVDPSVPDVADVGRRVVAAGLRALERGGVGRPPQLELRLPPAWRDDAALTAGVAWRRRVAEQVGLTDELERLQLEWGVGTPLVPTSGRLRLAPDGDDAPFLALFRRVAAGSLDETSRRAATAGDEEGAARENLAFYLSAPGAREWWRIAYDADGHAVGFVIPSATDQNPNIGYLGVVPEARGRGYVDDLLAEATRFHAERGAVRITATTDVPNVPMAAAFARHGYRVTARRIDFSAPAAAHRPLGAGGKPAAAPAVLP